MLSKTHQVFEFKGLSTRNINFFSTFHVDPQTSTKPGFYSFDPFQVNDLLSVRSEKGLIIKSGFKVVEGTSDHWF